MNYLYTLDKCITGKEKDDNFKKKNRRAYAKLVQAPEECSLQLIINDSSKNGRAAFNILK